MYKRQVAAAATCARRAEHATATAKASLDDPEAQCSDLDGSVPSTDGGSHRGLPSFRGASSRTGDLFNTSDTGSEFDPITGAFVDKKHVQRERNKLAAKGYRQRKRISMESVEQELEEARKQNVVLQQTNTVLRTENGLLREQLEFFRKALAGNLGAR